MFDKILKIVILGAILSIPAAVSAADITTIQVVSQAAGEQTQAPVTLGHVFAPGDVKSNEYLSARFTIGDVSIPLQVDKKATHADGSLRHAILTLRFPVISAGSQSVTLSSSTTPPPPAPAAIAKADLQASSFDFNVALNVAGTVYQSSVKDLLTGGTVQQWLAGGLVSEWLISGPLKDSSNNEHPHLTAYYHVRAYGPKPVNRVRVNVIVENTWSYAANPQNYNYTATLTMPGMTDVTHTLEHYHHARWNQYFWWGSNPKLDVSYEKNYFLDTGAVTNYDRSIKISETYLNNNKLVITNWSPMTNGAVTAYMPGTGAHDDIGPLPRWTAAYVISQDIRAKKATLLNGQASGSYPLHFRDKGTGKPVSIDLHPKAGPDPGNFPNLVGSMAGQNPAYSDPTHKLMVDTAHHPDLAYIPYMVTGDYFFMEELQFWANYCMLRQSYAPYHRNYSEGLIMSAQLRAEGWCLRTMGEAAYLTPDADDLKAYFKQKVVNNLNNYDNVYTNGEGKGDPRWNIFGVFKHTGYSNSMNNSRPWMDDFVTWAVGHLVELGINEAKPLRAWKAQYPVGRMTKMCYIEAINYSVEVGTNNPDTFFTSWAELYDINYGSRFKAGVGYFKDKACASQEMADWKKAAPTDQGSLSGSWTPGMMSGRAYAVDSYYANAQPAMAIAKDSGILNADIAWNLFVGKNTDPAFPYPGSPIKPDYSSAPQWAVVPREQPVKETGPTISISASPGVVESGGKSILNWTTLNADTCTASGGWSGDKVTTSGSEEVGPITVNTSFHLDCSGPSGGNTATAYVNLPGSDGGGGNGGGGNGGGDGGNGGNGNTGGDTPGTGGGGGALSIMDIVVLLSLLLFFHITSGSVQQGKYKYPVPVNRD